jgi:hypothetical protein
MTDPINLTQLRADIEADDGYGDSWHIAPWLALALIDTAEAAIEYCNGYIAVDHPAEKRNKILRLRETLNHYTTTP